MGAGVAFQAPIIMRPNPPASRAPSGSPTKPSIPTSLPGFPGIPVFQVPRTIIQGIVKQSGLPVPTRKPLTLPPPTYDPTGPYTSAPPVLTGPISGPGITDTGGAPPAPPPMSAGGGGGDGSGGGGVSVAASAHIPWLTIALIAGGLYLVTRS